MFITIIYNFFEEILLIIYNYNLSILLISILLSILFEILFSIFELIIIACKKTDDSEIKILLKKLNIKLDYKNVHNF